MWVGNSIQEFWHGTVDMQRKVPLRPCFAHSWKSAMYMCCVAHILDIMRIHVRRACGSTCGEFRVFLHDVMWGGTIDGYCGRP